MKAPKNSEVLENLGSFKEYLEHSVSYIEVLDNSADFIDHSRSFRQPLDVSGSFIAPQKLYQIMQPKV